MRLHLDDKVLVTTGKYSGKTGKIIRKSEKHDKIVVEKVNMRTKHIKKRQGQPGQRISFEAPMPAANVMIICPNCSKATRIGMVILKTGKKQRVCKKCSQSLDKAESESKKTSKKS